MNRKLSFFLLAMLFFSVNCFSQNEIISFEKPVENVNESQANVPDIRYRLSATNVMGECYIVSVSGNILSMCPEHGPNHVDVPGDTPVGITKPVGISVIQGTVYGKTITVSTGSWAQSFRVTGSYFSGMVEVPISGSTKCEISVSIY